MMNNINELRKRRIEQDLIMMQSPKNWPQPSFLCLKTQPWIEGEKRHGILREGETRVWSYGGKPSILESYNSLEELVQYWSVD